VKYGANEEMNHVGVYLPYQIAWQIILKCKIYLGKPYPRKRENYFIVTQAGGKKQKGKGDKGKEPVNDMKNKVYGRL